MRVIGLVALLAGGLTNTFGAEIPLEQIQLPPGFVIETYATDVPSARAMSLGSKGTLFVGSRSAGNVYAVTDSDGDHRADRIRVIASDLTMPTGIAYSDGDLFIGDVGTIYRMANIESQLDDPLPPVVVTDAFPDDKHHGWKFIEFGPDGKLYVPVGAPCNICDERGYAEIRRMDRDGSNIETFAKGVRNTVGFDWHPETGALWFTDNGRDWLGDDRPPCELNRAATAGLHFGYPYCHGKDIIDPEFGKGRDCADFEPPAQALGPHVAPLGMAFYTGDQFPARYRNAVFIAEHGSWNRGAKIGYRVTVVMLEDGVAKSYETFAQGWLQGEENWGRPVDVLVMPDGALLISDDQTGTIYRVTYSGGSGTDS